MPQQVTFDMFSTYYLLDKKEVIFILAINGKAKKKPKIRSLYLFNTIQLNTKCFS